MKRFRLPAGMPSTLPVWIALILLSFVLSAILEAPRSVRTRATSGLNGAQFTLYQRAEIQTRLAFGLSTSGVSPAEVADLWTRLAKDSDAPGVARRALVVRGAQNLPYDPSLVDDLVTDRTAAGAPGAAIQEEARLWRAIYGPEGSQPGVPPDAEERLRALRLGFLTESAVADAVSRRDGAAAGDLVRESFQRAAEQSIVRLMTLIAVPGLLGLFGVGLWMWTLVTLAGRRRWMAVGAIAVLGIAATVLAFLRALDLQMGVPLGVVAAFFAGAAAVGAFFLAVAAALRERHWMPPASVPGGLRGGPGWGDWADGFVFYLALYRWVQLLAALALSEGAGSMVPAMAAAQAGSGAVAIGYLWWRLNRRGWSLGSMGWTARHLAGDIVVGIGGYAMLLPLMGGLGALSQRLFENNPNTTPNPVIPLLASAGAPERVLLFVMAALVAPILEEFFFRGALYTSFRERMGWLPSAVVSTLIFASLHPVQDWLPICALGFGFAAMRERRGSLVPGIVAHALQNGMASLFTALLFGG